MTPTSGPAIRLSDVSVICGPRPQEVRARMLTAGGPRTESDHTAALVSASVAFPPGALSVVMGLSGSGKSTLLRCINRLVTPISGSVLVGGIEVTTLSPPALRQFRRDTIAMVFQHFGLLPRRNVLENVIFPLRVQGRPRAEASAAAGHWLTRLGLAAVAMQPVEALSSGMQQRVGLARALVSGAPVLLMDEPFGALDPITRRVVQDELKDLQRDLRKTVVLITHDPREALRLADHVVVIRDGRVVQAGAPDTLRSEPADDHVRALLASADL